VTTWTLKQVRQVEGLRAVMHLDASLAARANFGVKTAAAEKMARRLTDMAYPFAVELHPADFEVVWEDVEGEPWHIVGRMRWRPSVREVEFRGGRMDGMRLEVQQVGEPIEVARPMRPVGFFDTAADESIALERNMYRLAGWREDERVWVYEAR
jgi:hypothetical protein